MTNIIGANDNDTLFGSYDADTINGKGGNDTITGGGGKDQFVFQAEDYIEYTIITDFIGVGKGTNPTAAVIAEADTLNFQGYGFTAQNMLLTQNGSNLEITFGSVRGSKFILQNGAS